MWCPGLEHAAANATAAAPIQFRQRRWSRHCRVKDKPVVSVDGWLVLGSPLRSTTLKLVDLNVSWGIPTKPPLGRRPTVH